MDENYSEGRHGGHRNRPGIFGPLLLILIGAIFLLDNLNVFPWRGWQLVFMFWPVIFILGGLEDLIRNRKVAGPAFGISLGVVLLLNNLGMLSWGVWGVLLRFWPVILIAVGIELIAGKRSWWGSALAALLIIGTTAGAIWWTGLNGTIGQPLTSDQVTQSLEDASRARVVISPATGNIVVYGLQDSGLMIDGTIDLNAGENIQRDFHLEEGTAVFTLQSMGVGTVPSFGAWEEPQEWNLGITTRVPVNLAVRLGAGQSDINLTGMRLSDLEINTAVGRTTVTLPAEGNFSGEVEGAIGEVRVIVPKSLGVRIDAGSVLGDSTLPAGYERRGGYYYSPNYDESESKVTLKIDVAIGQLIVEESNDEAVLNLGN